MATYNNLKKNKIREEIVKIIKDYSRNLKGKGNILTLETEEYLLPKLLTDYNFCVYQNDKEAYDKMKITKPKNVSLHFGDIAKSSEIDKKFDVIYLDFCCGYDKAADIILKMDNKLAESDVIGFTFCLRKNEFNNFRFDDYKLEMQAKVQNILFLLNLKPISSKSYRDSTPMITLFFENIRLKGGKRI